MSIIGNFVKTDTGFKGAIQTLAMKLPDIALTKAAKRGDSSPDFKVTVTGIDCGGGWNKTSREDKNKKYVSVAIDDPSLPNGLNFSLFDSGDGKTFQAVWNRPQPRTN